MLALRRYARGFWLFAFPFLTGCGGADRPLAADQDAPAMAESGPVGLGAPTGLTQTIVSTSRIDVSWTDNASRENGFEVQRSAIPGGAFAVVTTTGANVIAHGDTGLAALTQYCHRVRAFRTSGSKATYSGFSSTACATTLGPPSAPSGAEVRPVSSSAVSLSWTDNSGTEDGFRMERSATTEGPWTTVATTGANVSSYLDAGRTGEQRICYRAIAFDARGESSPSNVDCTVPPAGPTGLAAVKADHQTIDLAWSDESQSEDGYEVQRSTVGTGGPFSAVAGLPANSSGYRDGALTGGTAYWYRVLAKRDGGFSDPSNADEATTDPAPLPPAPQAPSEATAAAWSSSTVAVTWLDNAQNEGGFRVQRSSSGAEPWETIGTNGPNATRFTDTGRASEQRVCYRVTAFNAGGDSDPSNIDCSTPLAGPTALSATTVDYHRIDVTWVDNSNGEDIYHIGRSTVEGGPYHPVKVLGANITSWRDENRNPQTTYWYQARAATADATSDPSNVASATTGSLPPPPPGPPPSPSATMATPWGGPVSVTWRDNSLNESGFRVQRSPEAEATWATIATIGPSGGDNAGGSIEDWNVPEEQETCYRVVAFNDAGESAPSGTACTAVPSALSVLMATPLDHQTIELTWFDLSRVEDSYDVERADGYSMGMFYVIATLPANATSYRDTGLTPGQEYTYQLRLRRDGGWGATSMQPSATTPDAPPEPN
jgi:hypothetical protein